MNFKINIIALLILSSITLQAAYHEMQTISEITDYLVLADKQSEPCDLIIEIVNLPVFADTNSGTVSLTGSPAGGVFSGNGVFFNGFNPIVSGPGIHEITYTYTDPATGCEYIVTGNILVFTVIDTWVSYSIGVIQPKLANITETFPEESGEYDLLISDLTGRIVHQNKVASTKDFQLQQFNEVNLPKGLYVATLRNNEQTFSKKMMLGR